MGLVGARATVRQLAEAFTDLQYEVLDVIAEADRVAVHCRVTGRHTGPWQGLAPTDRPFTSDQVHILRFLDGRAVEHWAVRDDLQMLRDLGVLSGTDRWSPAPPAGRTDR